MVDGRGFLGFSWPRCPYWRISSLISYLPRKNYWSIFSFIQQSNAIQKQLNDSPGLLGYSLRAQLLGKKAWTLSVWQSERALSEFVGRSPHVDTMKKVSLGEERKFVRWNLMGSEVPPKWEEALKRLEHG